MSQKPNDRRAEKVLRITYDIAEADIDKTLERSRRLSEQGGFWSWLGMAMHGFTKTLKLLLMGHVLWLVMAIAGPGVLVFIFYLTATHGGWTEWKSGASILFSVLLCGYACLRFESKLSNAELWEKIAKHVLESPSGDLAQIQKSSPIYVWFVRNFAIAGASLRPHPMEAAADLLGAKFDLCATYSIQDDIANSTQTATDYLCVIYADGKSAFFNDDGKFRATLEYFSKFDRFDKPLIRIVRVFSVPATKSGSAFEVNLSSEQKARLYCYLWINWAVGVETKLHVFDKGCSDDFFQVADYVCKQTHASGQGSNQKDRVVFVAKAGNEQQCYKISDGELVHRLFQFEFYQRITDGAGARDSDVIFDINRRKLKEVKRLLLLNDKEAEMAKSSIERFVSTCSGSQQEHLRVKKKDWDGARAFVSEP